MRIDASEGSLVLLYYFYPSDYHGLVERVLRVTDSQKRTDHQSPSHRTVPHFARQLSLLSLPY